MNHEILGTERFIQNAVFFWYVSITPRSRNAKRPVLLLDTRANKMSAVVIPLLSSVVKVAGHVGVFPSW